MLNAEQKRIAAALRMGMNGAPDHPESLVHNKRSDIVALLDALDSETQRADTAEKAAAAAPTRNPLTAEPAVS
jgi:hypothetical protein